MEDAILGKNKLSSDIMAITQYPHENVHECVPQDLIPNLVEIDYTPKATRSVMRPTDMGIDNRPKEIRSVLGPKDMRGVISEVTGLYSVPTSYMQSRIDPVGLVGVMHVKERVQGHTHEVSHARATNEGTRKASQAHERGRLETEISTECTTIKVPRKRHRSKGHELDKTASTVEARGQPPPSTMIVLSWNWREFGN